MGIVKCMFGCVQEDTEHTELEVPTTDTTEQEDMQKVTTNRYKPLFNLQSWPFLNSVFSMKIGQDLLNSSVFFRLNSFGYFLDIRYLIWIILYKKLFWTYITPST